MSGKETDWRCTPKYTFCENYELEEKKPQKKIRRNVQKLLFFQHNPFGRCVQIELKKKQSV